MQLVFLIYFLFFYFLLNKPCVCSGFFKQKCHTWVSPCPTVVFSVLGQTKGIGQVQLWALCSPCDQGQAKRWSFVPPDWVVVVSLGRAGRGGGKDTARGHQCSGAAGSGGGCVLGREGWCCWSCLHRHSAGHIERGPWASQSVPWGLRLLF